jgi:MOSC domain-containing protein YiiM
VRLVSVNVGRPGRELLSGRELETAILKNQVEGPVAVGPLGIAGDEVADRENHGGPDQAVYLYTVEDYAWWAKELGRRLDPGTFGENLTVSGLESAELAVGDRFRIGEVELEVTAPRIPCSTFAARMGDAGWVKRFARAGRPGAYLRVLATGAVAAGDEVSLDPAADRSVPLLDLVRLFYDRKASATDLERALGAPVAERARADLERRLAQTAT